MVLSSLLKRDQTQVWKSALHTLNVMDYNQVLKENREIVLLSNPKFKTLSTRYFYYRVTRTEWTLPDHLNQHSTGLGG